MRQYQPIWNQVKKHKVARIVAPISVHRRIIQAVRKEKAKDLANRLDNAENKIRTELKCKIVHINDYEGTIKFTLDTFKVTKIDMNEL